MALLQFTTPIK